MVKCSVFWKLDSLLSFCTNISIRRRSIALFCVIVCVFDCFWVWFRACVSAIMRAWLYYVHTVPMYTVPVYIDFVQQMSCSRITWALEAAKTPTTIGIPSTEGTPATVYLVTTPTAEAQATSETPDKAGVRHVTGNDQSYLRKIPRAVVQISALL